MDAAPQPHVSIVIPLYNNREHLAECLESILAQTYQDWDCTVVNNCSTDGSAEIAHDYAAKHARIRVYDNPHFLPAIANHNASLRLIAPDSKYCKVVFADDWIYPECLQRMVSVAERNPTVGIVGAYFLWGLEVKGTGLQYQCTVFSGLEVCRRHLLDRVYVFGSANSLLFRADLVRCRDPFYDEANIHTDTEVCFSLLRNCDFGFVHQVLTFTRVRDESLNARSVRAQTSLPGWLHMLVTQGPAYLSEEELRKLLDEHLVDYYRFLGKSLLVERSREFWTFHKRSLIESGVGFERVRLARGALVGLLTFALNPKKVVERLRARRRPDRARHVQDSPAGGATPSSQINSNQR